MIHALTVPMRYNNGELLGAVQVRWEPSATTDASGMGAARNVLDTIAGLCSQALQRVQLSEATERVAALAAQLSASRTTTQVIRAILVAAPQILGAQLLSVAVPDDGHRLRLWHHDLPTDLAEQYADLTIDDPRPIAEALRTRTRIIIADRDDYRARYPGLPDTAGSHGLTTTIAVPLLNHQGRPLAVIGMGWSRHRPLRSTDLALLDTITDLCEQTLERTRLAAAEHDLVTRLAGRVTTTPPRHPQFDIAVRYQPALTGLNLGGDWYDVIALSGDRLAVIVGDVVGHQVEAAAEMAQMRTILNTLVRLDTPLPDVFARVTALLGRGFFGTAIVMVIDPGTGRLHVTRAGHPHPLLLPATGPARILHTPANRPLGMVNGPTTITNSSFDRGDTIVAFTDGLVERRTRTYDHGVEDLRIVLSEAAGQPLDAIADTILDRIPGTEDDRAVTLVRRR
jgi:GAF domain-containing protein